MAEAIGDGAVHRAHDQCVYIWLHAHGPLGWMTSKGDRDVYDEHRRKCEQGRMWGHGLINRAPIT